MTDLGWRYGEDFQEIYVRTPQIEPEYIHTKAIKYSKKKKKRPTILSLILQRSREECRTMWSPRVILNSFDLFV